jgi:hypothetical protein
VKYRRVVRNTIILAVLTLASTSALAKAPPADKDGKDKRAARRALDLNETGEHRDIELQLHTTVDPAAPSTTEGVQPAEHGPGDAPAARTEGAPLAGGAVEELLARQMRRNVRLIDACLAEAAHREPARAGQLTLDVTVVARKVTSLAVTDDKVGDPALTECLKKSASTWGFSLQQAHFQWPVTLGPAPFGSR